MKNVKDKVMAIHPNAISYVWTDSYCIYDNTGSATHSSNLYYIFDKTNDSVTNLSGWHKTENRAWDEAWERIQDTMLKKFEE